MKILMDSSRVRCRVQLVIHNNEPNGGSPNCCLTSQHQVLSSIPTIYIDEPGIENKTISKSHCIVFEYSKSWRNAGLDEENMSLLVKP